MVEKKRHGRKLLVASIGVAAVSYVACGGRSTTSGTTDPDAGTPPNAGGMLGAGGNVVIGNLAAPICSGYRLPDSTPAVIGQSAPLDMTNVEYDRTVRDLLGDTSAPSKHFPPDSTPTGFRVDPIDLSSARVASYEKAAGDLADAAVGRLDQILPCSPATAGEDACGLRFAAAFGLRAYRRPLAASELDELNQAYQKARANGTFAGAIRAQIAAALSSPHFYRIEEGGTSATPVLLEPYALASRLSYFLYRSMPDAQLFAAAEAGKLSSHDEIAAEVRRMLQDPKAHDAVSDFFFEWLGLDRLSTKEKSADLIADFASVRDSMVTETTTFATSIFFGSGLYTDLLTSSSTWANADIAAIYDEPFTGVGFQPLVVNASVRAGLLTHPSILAITSGPEQSSPTQRGKFVREKLLCQPIPPPPPNLPMMVEPVSPGVTTRRRYEKIATMASCAGCHRQMDPIGYGLEGFDAVGRFRTTDNGQPVDGHGSLSDADVAATHFTGAVELAHSLASGGATQDCITLQWFRFAISRMETDEDACSLDVAQTAMHRSGNMTDVVVAIATSDAFRYARWVTVR